MLQYFVFIYVLLLVLLMNFKYIDSNFFNELFELFGRDSTLSGRVTIWEVSWRIIEDRLLFGYGFDTNILFYNGIRENNPHNGILFVLLSQGLCGFIALFIIVCKMIRINCVSIDNKICLCCYGFIMAWSLTGLVESSFGYQHFAFWFSMITIYALKNKKINEF